MSYNIIPWTQDLDLSEFYYQAGKRGFTNNSSQKTMIDCFKNEVDWRAWILYYNDIAVGSVAAHTIDEGYRICARTCVLTDLLPTNTLRTRNQIQTHQHVTAQFFMPVCIDYVGDVDMYITTHASDVGTQRLVHNIWAPTLVKSGVLTKAFDKVYRGYMQSFYKLNKDVFLEQLDTYGRW